MTRVLIVDDDPLVQLAYKGALTRRGFHVDIAEDGVAALKAMVELLIEKGVFSRDEYIARVKR